jgi:hypothetical protein
MRMFTTQNGAILIDEDKHVVERAQNEDLSNVDVSKYRLNAEELGKVFLDAQTRKTVDAAKEYVVLKQKYLEKFSRV